MGATIQGSDLSLSRVRKPLTYCGSELGSSSGTSGNVFQLTGAWKGGKGGDEKTKTKTKNLFSKD